MSSCSGENHPRPPLRYRLMQALMGPVMRPLKMSCRDFAELCSVKMDRPLTFSESLRYRFHALMCGVCRRLPRQFDAIREAMTSCDVCGAGDHDTGHDESETLQHPEEMHLDNDALSRIRERIGGGESPGRGAE